MSGLGKPCSSPNERANDSSAIRRCIKRSIDKSRLTRAQIAEAMTAKLGGSSRPEGRVNRPPAVTLRMLNGWTAGSCYEYRIPLEFALAFCEVLNDYRLLREIVSRAGFRMVGPKEERLLRIGSAIDAKAQAERVIAREVSL